MTTNTNTNAGADAARDLAAGILHELQTVADLISMAAAEAEAYCGQGNDLAALGTLASTDANLRGLEQLLGAARVVLGRARDGGQ